ncbi:MAG: amino acid adenylation domain-containing protein, partial [Verrucomicrobiota bacterium JB022]|nr:amino acid adenylation domain-containing protein [Verrucomicrobiota bacterium JB022]
VAVDTMCSSSLSAIHLACESLRRGESELALAGGVNLIVHPQKYALLSQGRFASTDGRCRAFGEGGDGYVPGEGVGAVLLKPLERALADGDAIHAVIRGSALNHGGRLAGSGYTVPSPLAQADVIRQALEDAGVPPESISYIEAHGTGTALGDPVEISGLSKVFGQAGHAIAVGSVKSNIGHLESAAGIAGLTKVLLQLKHRRIAPSLLHHPEGQLNAKIDFASTPFVVPTEGREWASTTGPRRAALSAFGAGGSNAHLILEEAPEAAPAHELASPQLIVLSAQNKSRLQAMARELAAWLEAANNGSNALPRVAELLGVNPSDLCLDDSLTDCGLSADQIRQLASESGRDALTAETHLHELAGGNRLPLAALAATLQTARETMPERLAFVASSVSAVISHLRNFLEGQAQDLWLGRVEEEAEDSFDPFDLPLDEVARRWVAGQPVTWAVSGPRLRLPGTLFGGRAHWIRTAAATPAATSALLHPLLHRNVSRLHGAAFETTWQASDSLLRDHQIQHRATLPGATCVEMLQAAAELATGESPSTLTDIAWLQPLQVADGPKTTRLELQPQGDALRASLRSGDTLLAQATIASTQALQAPTIDLARWRAEASEPVPLGEFYPEAARRGLSYGPTLRTLESVWRGPEAVVVQLRLRQTGICRFAPELLDGALQATAFLGGDEGTGWLPVALERVQLHQPLGPEVWVRLVESSRTADERVFKLTLADPTGLVCLQLDGLHVRRLSPEKPRGPAPLLLHKIWKGCQTTSRTPFETVVTAREGGWQLNGRDYPMAQTVELWASLRGIDRLQLTLDATDPLGSLSSFFQGALKAGVRAVEVACVVGDNVRLAAAVAGFGRSLARENAAYRLVSIEGPISSWTNDPFIEHLRKGQRPAWQELAATPAQTRLRKGGVYWITGGASGVGRLVARHLACNYQAHLVLSGRRSPDRETESLLAELQTTGAASVTYLACDVASRASVDTAVAAIEQQHGRLHGIFHSAGVLRDRLLPSKMAEDWQSVEAPKVDGVRHLDAGTVHLSLDFLVLFSSIAAELGGMGQTDYAFANGYLDGFAAWREAERLAGRRKGVCRSINWPYWREGGMRLSDAALKALDANLGLQPLETVAGLEVLETILAAAAPQVMVLPGDTARLRSLFLPAVDKPLVASTPTKARPGRSAARLVTEVLAEVLRVPVPDIRLQEKLDRYGVDSVAAMALTDALEQKVGSLPKTLLYECDTVSALAEQLQELHPEAFKEDIETAPTPAPVPMPSLITSTMALEQMTTADDAVAVIGLSGRYPASPDLDTLWENLRQGRNCVGEIPASRWEAEGASGSRFGGFIEGIEDFDPLLFQISPREAEQLDPQARLFLEAAWHAFEDAGYSPLRIAREQDMAGGAGVWVSSMYQHYPYLLGDTEAAARLASGAHWTIVNRTSYCFDLRGPSLSVDTACSGSLTALHLACESIRRGEVPFALVGGINLTLHRGKFAALQQMNLLSKGDETRSLGQGDGFVAGEGVGACILKPLAAARRDGDRIYGIIRGSAVNHGGRTNGFTVPSVQAQATLIERGLARAGLRPTDIDCVEVAANGSPLGDPIEFSALKRVFRSVTTPVRLGSVKSNLGHLEAASGLSQLTKVLLQFQAQTLVPTLHADPLNPAVELGGTPFRLQQTAEPWTSDKPCRVLIDSFGAGGANAMLVVESVVAAEPAGTFPGAQLLPLSARTPEALRRQAASLRAVLAGKHAQTPLADVAYTLQIGRAQLAERLALTVENTSEAVAALDEFLSTQSRRGTHWERDTADARLADAFDAASLQAFAGSLHRLALLWIKGAEVDWEQVLWAQRRARVVSLPGYAFDRVRCWLPDSVSPQPPVAQVVASTLESPSAGGLREIVAELLKLEPAQLDADCDLRDYGFDSLLGLQLIQRLQETFGVSISPVELFDQPTLAALEARLPSAVSVEKSEHTSASSREPFALSRGQAALWSLARLDPDDYAYNLPCGFRIRQALDTHAFAEALDRVVARHEALQVTVEVVDGQPRQRLLPEPPKLELISWSGVEEGELPDRLLALGRAPFTLEGGPLFRAQLVQLGAADYALVLTAHHIVFDGMSLTVLLGELIKAYEALRRNQPVELEPLPAQYRDFVAWQQEMLAGSQGLRARQYWTERLAGELPQLELPTDRARGAQPSPGGAVFTAELDASTTEQLKALARREGVNLFTLMCGTWCALLHRYSGERRIIVGTPVAGRPHSAFGHLVGYFANLMPLVQHIEPETPFRDLLKDLQRALLEGVEHGDYPFSELIHHLDLERSPDSNPVFRVVFGFQNWLTSLDASTAELLAAKGEAGDRLVLETIPEVHQSGEFDLMLSVVETSGKCLVFYKYRPALFDEATLARMHRHYVVILQAALADAARPVAAIPLLDMQERRALEALTTVPSPAYPREQSIEALFAEQVDEHGERTAISCGERKLTYRELEHRADCYACGLLEHGVKAGDAVCLRAHRSVDFVAVLLGILRLGAYYVPIDPTYPEARVQHILELVWPRIFLDESGSRDALDFSTVFKRGVNSHRPLPEIDRQGDKRRAYVMFTSGSTGEPKGVEIPHRGIVRLVRGNCYSPLGPDCRVAHLASVAFDAATYEIWGPLLNGGEIVLYESTEIVVPDLANFLAREQPTALFLTAGLFDLLAREHAACFAGVQRVLTGGDVVSPVAVRAVQQAAPDCEVVNAYGPTENTTFSTYFLVPSDWAGGALPLGSSIAHTEALVCDASGQPAPLNVWGEICLGGDGLANGYFGNPKLTAQAFVAHPLRAGQRIYRTGDRGRWRADGLLEFGGRLDRQVKIRGFRIELGDIESALQEHPQVEQAAVFISERPHVGKQIEAVLAMPGQLHPSELRAWLRDRLPPYMLPAQFHFVRELPLNRNGKVDRSRLAALAAEARPAKQAAALPPRDPVERRLAEIWQRLLDRADPVGREDDFFELGGHSLVATQLITMVEQEFGVQVSLRTFFAEPTVAALARWAANPGDTQTPEADAEQAPALASLTAGQAQLWFLQQVEPSSSAYNVPLSLDIMGELDAPMLIACWQTLVERHEALRTRFVELDGEPRQELCADWPKLEFVDAEAAQGSQALDWVRQDVASGVREAFDLAAGPPWRGRVYRVAAQRHVVCLNLHHIIVDGWSAGLLLRELGQLYEANLRSQPLTLSAPGRGWFQIAQEEQTWLASEAAEAAKGYWRRALQGAPPVSVFPPDRSRGLAPARGANLPFAVPSALQARLFEFCRRERVTPYTVLLATLALQLRQWTGEDDCVIGTPVANRSRPGVDSVVGYCVNTLAMRQALREDDTFRRLLERVSRRSLEAFEHQRLPFDRVVELAGVERRTGVNPLFQIMLSLENNPKSALYFGEAEVQRFDFPYQDCKFDLTFEFSQVGQTLEGWLEYDASLYDLETVQRIANGFEALLACLLKGPDTPLREIPAVSVAEVQALQQLGLPPAPIPPGSPLFLQRWGDRVQQAPHAVAVHEGDRRWTYEEIDRRSSSLAAALGRQPAPFVGVLLERSTELVVAILAIWKAGRAYLPLSRELPAARLQQIVADAGLQTVIGDSADPLPEALATCTRVKVDAVGTPHGFTPAVVKASDPAYMIYTSGSTGRPKGVVVTHGNVAALCVAMPMAYELGARDRVLQFASPLFDVSVEELFPTLATGGTVVPFPAGGPLEAREFELWLAQAQPTVLNLPTAFWQHWVRSSAAAGWMPESVRLLIVGGEAPSPEVYALWRQRHPRVRWLNGYGPTETTVTTTVFEPGADAPSGGMPIGRPLAHTQALVMDPGGNLLPRGATGELWLGGPAVAQGYWQRPELTANAFVHHPLTPDRLYRTGDRVRWNAAGQLEFHGRIDGQVKVRGFRIELGEVEACLHQHPAVLSAAVAVKGQGEGAFLAAYAVLRPEEEAEPEELRAYLIERLPPAAVPARVLLLPALPLNASGKIDRRALPEPVVEASKASTPEPTPAETKVLAVWREVLHQPALGVTDDFFASGGQSLLAVRLVARLREAAGLELSVGELIAHGNVRRLVAAKSTTSASVRHRHLHTLQSEGDGSPLYMLPGGDGECASLLALAHGLGRDRPFHAFETPGLRGECPPHRTIEAMARALLRLIPDPKRGWWLGGWSMGGVVAFEMVRQCEHLGLPLPQGLVVLDSFFASEIRHVDPHWTGDEAKVGENGHTQPFQLFEPNEEALVSYAPTGAIHVPVYFFEPQQDFAASLRAASRRRWRSLAQGSFETFSVPGNHFSMLQHAVMAPLAEHLRAIFHGQPSTAYRASPLPLDD